MRWAASHKTLIAAYIMVVAFALTGLAKITHHAPAVGISAVR